MSEIDDLCCLLDERDVEWSATGVSTIRWRVGNTLFRFDEWAGKSRLFMIGVTPTQAIEVTLGPRNEPPYERLVELLRDEWHIDASWDGLRRFWSVELTEEGVRERDEREATLGRGSCKMIIDNHHRVDKVTTSWGCVCSACGGFHKFTHGEGWAFCPTCGAEVGDE